MWKKIDGLVKKWYGKYCYFSKATMLIQGLVFSNSFVNHAIVSILITYLTFNWTDSHSTVAVVVTNVQEGVSNIMVILLAHISHNYTGGFKIIVTTQAVYILGLLLLWLSAALMSRANAARVYYGAAALLALGEAGRSACLEEFLDTQYISQAKQTSLESRRNFLWSLPWFLGAALPPFLLSTTWVQIFMISTIVMGVSYLLFWLGYSRYSINNKEKHKVVLFEEDQQEEPRQAEEMRGNFWTLIKQLKKTEGFSKETLAMWIPFFGYGFVLATGSTFFFEQMDNMSNPFSNYDPAIYFNVLSSFSKYLISFLWSLLIPEKWQSRTTRLRIGCGMALCMLCCFTAWKVEARRTEKIKMLSSLNGNASWTSFKMNIFWLVPQFFLLGAMEGLVAEGCTDYGVHRVTDDEKRIAEYYGYHIQDLIVGIVKLLSAVVVLASGGGIKVSRLDRYYRALTFATLATFCYYSCVALYFGKLENSSTEQHHQQSRNGNGNAEAQNSEIP